MIPDKIYIQPNAHDGWFEGNKPNDNFVEYIRKDIADGMVELAEDHALFAGREQMREEMMKDAVGHLDPPGENGVDGMSYLKGWNDRWKSMENDAVVGYIRESEGTHWIESKPDEKIHGKVGDEVKLIIVKED